MHTQCGILNHVNSILSYQKETWNKGEEKIFLAAPCSFGDLSSLTRDRTQTPPVKVQSSNHRTAREVFFKRHQRSLLKAEWSEVSQSCPTLCDPMDCSLPGSSVHGIFQARVLEWVAISFSRGSSQPRDWTRVSCITGRCFTIGATREASWVNKVYLCALSLTNLFFFFFLF